MGPNTCCSHQRVGESNIQAEKKVQEKWVLKRIKRTFFIYYKAPFDNGLTETRIRSCDDGLWPYATKD